jgi:rare lipoprotein A
MRSATARADPAPRVTGLALLLLVTSCATRVPPLDPPPQAGGSIAALPARPAPRPPVPIKIGKPYQVFGVTYHPADDRDYDQRGIASWYGPGFHALDTANGERYDQDDLTAAHKTLPMPSWVEVQNLDNGRKLTVRINDRGPFVAGRIIDLSRKSAQLLGVDRAGTARVRVRRVFPGGRPTTPVVIVAAAAVPLRAADPAPPPVRVVEMPGATRAQGRHFVQVAALSDPGRIAWLIGYLSVFGSVVTEKSPAGLTRVRLGPYADTESGNAALAQLRDAGYTDSRLVSVPPKP